MLTLAVLGGYMDEWTYIINGPCLAELSHCIDDAGDPTPLCGLLVYIPSNLALASMVMQATPSTTDPPLLSLYIL